MASEFLRKVFARDEQARFDGAKRKTEESGDFFQRVPFDGIEQQDEAVFFRKLGYGALEVELKFAGRGGVFCRDTRFALRPQSFALLATLAGAKAVERQAKADTNEPSAEALAITQTIEPAIGTQECFLGDVLGIGGIAQDTPRYAKGERRGFAEKRFKFKARSGIGRFAFPFALGHATGLWQSQLLHCCPWCARQSD